MAPKLDDFYFEKLHSSPNKPSDGTVTATGIAPGDKVHLKSRNGNKVWDGKVGTSAGGDTWNVRVTRTIHKDSAASKSDRDLELVTTTVTSGSETSNEI